MRIHFFTAPFFMEMMASFRQTPNTFDSAIESAAYVGAPVSKDNRIS